MPFPQFDRSQLRILPLGERVHDIRRDGIRMDPGGSRIPYSHPALPTLADAIVQAAANGRAVIFICGAHVLRQGNAPLLIDLMERGLLKHLALNGAGAIHDFELALIGQTCESVARYVKEGQFGLWQETSRLNDAVNTGAREGLGFGEAVGRVIEEERFPYRDTSVLAAGYRLKVPVTVHVSIGQDIVHEHPNFDGAATGAATFTDFLIFTETVTRLEGGVMLNIGSAVMGPEVYLKALAMARNVAHQRAEHIRHFTTAVFDLPELGDDLSHEAPKNDPRYYFRPFKTILVRTVADGGRSFYVQGDHKATVPALYDEIVARVR
uniref:Deoxyhypusine synthase n=1 Tax=Schlesneria paludicola TaxID=360056 RepID=A0A7C2P9U4_9PLAN